MPTQVQGLGLVDDQGNKSIVVNLSNARQMTNAEYQQLTPAQRNGAIIVTDFPIPEEDDTVSVTADGVKTYGTLLSELYALIDNTKLGSTSYIKDGPRIFRYQRTLSNSHIFALSYAQTTSSDVILTYKVSSNSSIVVECILEQSGITINDSSSGKPASGTKITLHYGTSSEIINVLTDADHCMMQDGSSVEDTLGGAKIYVEYRRNIVFNNSDSSDWFTPPSAISSKTIYGFTFASLSGGGGYTTKKLGENEFAIHWGSTLNMTIVCNLIWFYN